ncbi:MAG: hypothetical protein IIC59_12505 [Proteobacteria bacterium]|nr:hypothetical protein [Pseudomonadota bacterium]
MLVGRNKILMVMLILVAFMSQPLVFAINNCEKETPDEFGYLLGDANFVDQSDNTVRVDAVSSDTIMQAPRPDCNNQDCSIMGSCLSLQVPVPSDLAGDLRSLAQKIKLDTLLATSQLPSTHYRPPISR